MMISSSVAAMLCLCASNSSLVVKVSPLVKVKVFVVASQEASVIALPSPVTVTVIPNLSPGIAGRSFASRDAFFAHS